MKTIAQRNKEVRKWQEHKTLSDSLWQDYLKTQNKDDKELIKDAYLCESISYWGM